jgi:PAS domain S-box-containing protein
MRPAIERQLINGILTAIICVLAIVMLTIWQYRRMQDTGAIIKHTNEVLAQTGEVSATAMQYELNLKNFLLTGDSVYLAVAGDSMRLLPARIAALKALTGDNPHQQARLDSLSVFVARDQREFERVARDPVGQYSYQIQDVLDRVAAEERALLEQRRRVNQAKASELQLALWSLIVAVAVLALVVFRKIRLDLGREKLARVASENKYKTLFYKSPLPKWIYDEESLAFLEVNDAAVQLYGYTQEEFYRMTLADIRPPDEVSALMADIGLMRKNPNAYQTSQWRHVRKNGEIIDVQVTAHSIEFEGRRTRMVAIVDITERFGYELQLERLNADLGRLNEDLGRRAAELSASNAELERFAYIASHDLQEPLRMVSSFLQLLQKKYGGQLDAKADQYIHYAVDGAERMKALIMDLLEYSRVGTGKEGFGWVDTAGVMAELGAVFREKIVAARAQVEIGELPVVWGDKVQLTQLFQNLLSNALKYQREEPPVIRIGTKAVKGGPGAGEGGSRAGEGGSRTGEGGSRTGEEGSSAGEGEQFQFFVADNGIGIDPLFFEKIFIIFQRLHNKSDYSGTGIGLAICKKIVERHGGKIWVESDPQQGSVFYFTINNIKS